jgi:H+-translocating NAD(P) transhydrogenase subunit alpha
VKIAVPKETKFKENRVALTPDTVKELVKKGFECIIEAGAGMNSYYADEAYTAAGARIEADNNKVYGEADVVLKVNAPAPDEIAKMKKEAVLISFMWAATNPGVVEACCKAGISAFSMAANTIGKILPMMTTAAGTIRPSKVVIFGAGVAGLQAIATAKRLGAVVEVTDIRPETKEQVESLGGKFIEVKGDDSIKIEGGYVKGVSEEFLKKQQELVAKHVKEADIIITTALIPGKKAPVLVTEEMVKSMRFGSVIVDMAVEQGGNVVGSEVNKTVVKHGVTIIGESNIPSLLPLNASDLYAKNIITLLLHLADKDKFKWEMEEEITKGSLIVHNGNAVHPTVQPKPVTA